MIHAFDEYRMDVDARELRRGEAVVPLEPQVFDLLRLLIENRERVVGRDELIERIWGGRIVSDAAVSSRIKSARQAIGDDGKRQAMIRTLHGVGFRFVGAARAATVALVAAGPTAQPQDEAPSAPAAPSIAVLPFRLVGVGGPYAAIADGLAHDLIVELARLRWLTVIARESSFQLRNATSERVRAALGVRYALAGVVAIAGGQLTVTIEVSRTDDDSIVWSEVYRGQLGAVHEMRAEIASAVAAALDLQIPFAEARRALAAPSHLDAWAAYHLGLTQLFRYDRDGAERAKTLFGQAIAREPGFARAHAGLSFAHFEGAFLRFADDRSAAIESARRCAEESVALDPLDPFCNLVMGRAGWLTGDLEGAIPWLDRAVDLSPNYAQAKYSSAWTRVVLGEGRESRRLVDAAMALSPIDPLLYGMLGVRAFTHMMLDEPAEAARWAERAARSPRAHELIELIAAIAHDLNGDEARAAQWVRSALARRPGLSRQDFFEAFPIRDLAIRARVEDALRRSGC